VVAEAVGVGAPAAAEREEALAAAVAMGPEAAQVRAVAPAAVWALAEMPGRVSEIRDWEIITAMVLATAQATAALGPRMAPDMAKPPRSDTLKDRSLWF